MVEDESDVDLHDQPCRVAKGGGTYRLTERASPICHPEAGSAILSPAVCAVAWGPLACFNPNEGDSATSAPTPHPCVPAGVRVVWTGTTAQGTLLPDTTCTD